MKKSTTKINLIYNFVYQITVIILPIITAPYISRMIGPEGLGIYSYNHSIALYFTYFAMLGITNYGNREIAKCTNKTESINKVFSSIYIIQLLTAFLTFIIYMIYVLLNLNVNKYVQLIMILHVCSTMFDLNWLFFGMQEFKLTSIRQLIIKLLSFVMIIIFVKGKNDLWIYVLIMSLSYFLSAFSLWVVALRKVKFVKCKKEDVVKNIKPILLLFIPIIATSVYRFMDKIMIGTFSTMENVGFYENAEKMILISLSLLTAFTTVLLPKITNMLAIKKKQEGMVLFDKSIEIAICYGMAVGFGIAAVSADFIPMFFGEEFIPSINISKLICITAPLICISTILRDLYLIPNEKDCIYIKAVVAGAVVNFVLNVIFINLIGVYGAVVGTITAELILTSIELICSRKEVNLKHIIKNYVIFGCFGIIMYGIIKLIDFKFLSNFAQIYRLVLNILIGGLIYSICCICYFLKNDNMVFRIIKK